MKALNIIINIVCTLGFITSAILAASLLWKAGHVGSTISCTVAHVAALWFVWTSNIMGRG